MAVSADLSKMGHYVGFRSLLTKCSPFLIFFWLSQISIVGLILQIISYSLFMALLVVFGFRTCVGLCSILSYSDTDLRVTPQTSNVPSNPLASH